MTIRKYTVRDADYWRGQKQGAGMPVSFYVDPQTMQHILALEEVWKISRSEVVRRLLHEALDAFHGAEAPYGSRPGETPPGIE